MASEDNFLRLDPYNFDTQQEFEEFYYDTRTKHHNRRDDASKRLDSTLQIRT